MQPFRVKDTQEGHVFTIIGEAIRRDETVFVFANTRTRTLGWMTIDKLIKCKWIGWVG